MAYGRIYANKGAMTPGVTRETVDGMSLVKIDRIIEALRGESYRWSPARRAYVVRRVALGCIPCSAGRNLEECFWV
jgi:retron-type reverse transcriptase